MLHSERLIQNGGTAMSGDMHDADEVGADETKYTRHRPRRHSRNNRTGALALASSNYKTVVLIMSLVMIGIYYYYDSNLQWRQQQGKENLLKRALHILAQQRRNDSNKSNSKPFLAPGLQLYDNHPLRAHPNFKNMVPVKSHEQLDDKEEGDAGDDKEQENTGDDKEEGEGEGTRQPTNAGPPPAKKHKRQAEDNDTDTDMYTIEELLQVFRDLNRDVRGNLHGGIRWVQDHLLRELPGQQPNRLLEQSPKSNAMKEAKEVFGGTEVDFNVKRLRQLPMAWEAEWEKLTEEQRNRGPKVDFTKHKYTYPKVEATPSENYPPLETLGDMLKRWPQDSIDDPPNQIVERLMHFDYSNETERQMALNYRKAELPFKVYNVPDVDAATIKWTDEYVTAGFDAGKPSFFSKSHRTMGSCQESHDNFFAFFTPTSWHLRKYGPPPYRNNDWTFKKWNQHAIYADAVALSFDQPHFYWQAGVPREERYEPPKSWSFVSRDLPLFSSTEANFFQFSPDEQKGIQCRFGERGVTAATHYDTGRNMVAMVKGAKRYILSPPRECPKLGIVTAKGNSVYRHSLLNFGHIQYLQADGGGGVNASSGNGTITAMPTQERGWLELSKTAMAIDTVLKAGEVLYIPSHWFHYITSLQRSAQCNVRSGVNNEGTEKFGGPREVAVCEA